MPIRPPGIPTLDLTTDGSFGALDGVVFETAQVQPAGTGNFNTFVQIQNTGVEQGYNTDGGQVLNDKSTFNHSVLLAQVPIVIGDGTNGTGDGVKYREFRLDINEGNSQTNPYLSLDKLQIWQEESGSLTGLSSSGFSGSHTNHLVYNLDANTDQWVALNDALSSGSGHSDIAVLIPDSFFANDAADRFVYLYSEFGMQSGWGADAGAEQWGLSTPNGPNVATNALAISKTVSIPAQDNGTADRVGEVLTYTVHVDNVGNTTLTHLTVTDPAATGFAAVLSSGFNVGDTNHNNAFDAGESWVYTGTHTVTQADLDNNGDGDGFITNTATAHTDQTGSQSANSVVPVVHNTGLELTKTPSVTSVSHAGDVINYAIDVQNTGTVTQTNLTVDDTDVNISTPVLDFNAPILSTTNFVLLPILVGDFNVGDTNQNGIQDPGETFQFAPQGDLNQNNILDPGETWVFANVGDTNQNGQVDTGETFQFYNAGDSNHNGVQDVGETFQFDVSHAATPVLSGLFNSGDTDLDGQLSPGETWHYTASYTLTQADIDNGGIVDPSLAHSDTATGTTVEGSSDATASVHIVQNPALTITKSADVASVDAAGDVIHYTVTVANAGNMTLTSPVVSDPFVTNLTLASGDTDNDGKLDVGETWTYTGSHTVTQAEIDNNGMVDPNLKISNTATADTAQTDPQTASATVDVIQNPHVSLTKTATLADHGATADQAGDVIDYSIVLTNDGNMTITNPVVSDPSVSDLTLASGDTNNNGKLDVGEVWHYTADHTVTQTEIDNGGVVNPALAINNTASVSDDQNATASASASVHVTQNPDLDITKTADVSSVSAVGDVISYTVHVTNAGNMTLSGISVSDPSVTLTLASGDTNSNGKLDLGENWVYTGSHTVTQGDLDTPGDLTNTATASSAQSASESASATVTVQHNPSITVSFVAVDFTDNNTNGVADAGDVINFAYTETNTGNMTLTNVGVTDVNGDVIISGAAIGTLTVGSSDSTTATGTHLINGTDVSAGQFTADATVVSDQAGASSGHVHTVLADLHPHV